MTLRKKNLWILTAILISGLLVTSCAREDDITDANGQDDGGMNIVEQTDFAEYINQNVYVGDDFYEYAVGKWLENNSLKQDQRWIGTMSTQEEYMKQFISTVCGPDTKDDVMRRLCDTYHKTGFENDQKVLKAKLDQVDAVDTKENMWTLMAQFINEGYTIPVSLLCDNQLRTVNVSLDFPESLQEFSSTGKTLMAYAGMTEEDTVKVMNVIKDWKDMLVKEKIIKNRLSGNTHRYTMSRKELFNLNTLARRAGSTNSMTAILNALQLEDNEKISADKKFIAVGNYLDKLTLDELKWFSKYNVINRDYLFMVAPADYKDDMVEGKGVIEVLTNLVNYPFSPVSIRLSGLYNKTIPVANRDAVTKMCEEFRTTFKERINSREWMSEATKQKAIEKLEAMQIYVGWPDDDTKRADWEVQVPQTDKATSTTYLDICDLFKQRTAIIRNKKGKKSLAEQFYANELYSSSYTANAFYSPESNSAFILAINLVAPIYDPTKSDAYNYAVLGASTIGHEMTHGFDSEGSSYSKDGKKENWWTAQDKQQFEALQKKMIDNFNAFTYGPGYQCDGKNTLAENIADLGGLYISYDTYLKRLKEKGISEGAEFQRLCREFFRAFGYAWMAKMSEKGWKKYLKDVHSAPCLRVNGNVYLMDAFYDAFQTESGKLYKAPDQRIEIW